MKKIIKLNESEKLIEVLEKLKVNTKYSLVIRKNKIYIATINEYNYSEIVKDSTEYLS